MITERQELSWCFGSLTIWNREDAVNSSEIVFLILKLDF